MAPSSLAAHCRIRVIQNTRGKLQKPWILREVTERDHGIDLYIEIVGNDEAVTGKMAGLQVKAVDQIKFKNGKATRQRQDGDRGDDPANGRAALRTELPGAALPGRDLTADPRHGPRAARGSESGDLGR